MVEIDHQSLASLRRMGFIEGVSTLVLFGIAMPLKYAADMPLAVTIVGTIHGFLFIALVYMLVQGRRQIPLSTRMVGVGVLCAFVPFGPFVYDRWLAKLA